MKRIDLFLLGMVLLASGCNKDGCIDPTALNYDPNAENDDGTCVYLAQNLNFIFHSKLGAADFAYNTEALVDGRKVKFTRAQMYMSGFSFNGTGGGYELADPHLLLKADEENYNLGYLPEGQYNSFTFHAGVDSLSNHSDPAAFPSTSALSSNNPDHMHWGWNSGYIFYVLEGMVDTTANMSGTANAPFIFHVGTVPYMVDLAFAKDITVGSEEVTIEMEVDWLQLLSGTNMVAADSTRSTHTMNNPALATLMVSNIEDAISLH